jgi:hypothetical protein
MSYVHVMYKGRQDDILFEDLFPEERYEAIGILQGTEVSPSNVTDNHIRAALAQYYDVGLNEFSDQYIEKNPNGNITIRANTPFG